MAPHPGSIQITQQLLGQPCQPGMSSADLYRLPDELQDVRLVRYNVLAVQQQPNHRGPRPSQGTLLGIPGNTQAMNSVSTTARVLQPELSPPTTQLVFCTG